MLEMQMLEMQQQKLKSDQVKLKRSVEREVVLFELSNQGIEPS